MSKSNSLTRSNSVETEQETVIASPKDAISPTLDQRIGSQIDEEEEEESGSCGNLNSSGKQEEKGEVVPSSPPPSYEFVLEETRLKAQVSIQSPTEPPRAPEIMHTSSKEFYKAVAKQFGITCKMSDHCRCYDCQSHYFDCEYEQNEQEKTDGGLGAGTPVFLQEVMHGTACSIL